MEPGWVLHPPVNKDPRGHKVPKDRKEYTVRKDPKDPLDHKDHRDKMEHLVKTAPKVSKVNKDLSALKVNKGYKARSASLRLTNGSEPCYGSKTKMEPGETILICKGLKELLGLLGLLGQPVLKG